MLVSIAQFQLFFLVFTRVIAILVQIPVFGASAVPNQIKIGLAFVLSMVVMPWQPLPAEAEAMPWVLFAVGIGRELLVGILAGFSASLVFGAFQIAGSLMDLSTGFSAGQMFNPALGEVGSSMSQFFSIMAILYFLIINGHHSFLMGLQMTFTLLPVNQALPELTYERLLIMTNGMILTGIQIAMPVLGALLLTDLTLGLLSRVAPQIQVFFLGMPVKIWVGLIGLALAFGYLLPVIRDLLQNMGPRMLEILGG
ncbi:MAG TPA: flagellar biosynthetic protein FliR [Anaerolineaceae bacterium]|nr:flagellar biosynthetic protein FliR [Anaerolineaceae bacterium]HPN52815.1 flagellar biosynthetic protein FliR [Anaerolineaceae bacterium]